MGFMFAAPTIFNTVFWHVINQTYNAILNFGNANKSSPVSNSDIMKSYVMAIIASCGAGASVRMLTKNISASATGGKLVIVNGGVTVVACALGGFANNYFIRQPELK